MITLRQAALFNSLLVVMSLVFRGRGAYMNDGVTLQMRYGLQHLSILRRLLAVTVFTGAVLLGHQTPHAYQPEDCRTCHSSDSTTSRLHISIAEFRASTHGEAVTCLDCHSAIEDEEHMTTPGCGKVDCSRCHDQQNRHGWSGKNENRPQCYYCHTTHAILGKESENSSIHPARLVETCRSCHPVACGQADALSFLPSVRVASHNKQDFSQAYRADNCIGCHQGAAAHGERELLDDQTCSFCHQPLGSHAALAGYTHVNARAAKQPVSFIAGIVYAAMLALLAWRGFRYYMPQYSRGRNTEVS